MITLLISLVVLGLILYLLTLIPMDAGIANIIRVVGIIIAVLMVLDFFFGLGFNAHLNTRFK